MMPQSKRVIPLFAVLVFVVLAAGIILFVGTPHSTTIEQSSSGTAGTNTPPVRNDGEDFERLAVFPQWNTTEPAAFPLKLKGEAQGTWFFEGSFPIEVRTPEGTLLGSGIAQAQESRMTEAVIPFSAEITRKPDVSSYRGMAEIILHKANPSGLPERDAQFSTDIRVDMTVAP